MSISWPKYRNAIQSCLDPAFGGQVNLESASEMDNASDNASDDGGDDGVNTDVTPHNKHLRTSIYQNIVCSLYDELQHAFGEYIEDRDVDKSAAEMDLFHRSSVTKHRSPFQWSQHL